MPPISAHELLRCNAERHTETYVFKQETVLDSVRLAFYGIHMIFNAARHGLKTIVFTSFSEGIEQYVEHMRSLDFFDASLIGDSVQLFTLASLITDEDATPATAIIRIIRTTGAKVVLLDGFQGADALLPADQAIRVLLSTLATQIRFLDTTLLVTIAGEVRDARFHMDCV